MSTVLILVLALVSPAFTLPFITQGGTTSGIQGGSITGTGIEPAQTGFINEKIGGAAGLPGGYSGKQSTTVETGNPTYQNVEKTGFQGLPQGYTGQQTTGSAGTPVEGSEPSQTYTSTNEKTGLETTQSQGTVPTYGTQTQGVPAEGKAEGHPISPEQLTYTESPVVAPLQSLPVVPSSVNPIVQLANPIVVPNEVVPVGRIVIMSVEPITQRVLLQNVVPAVEQQVPYQPTNQQPVAEYVPVQTQSVEPNAQVYSVQPVVSAQPVNVQKQAPVGQQAQEVTSGYTPVQPVTVQKQTAEQVPFGYTPTQTQTQTAENTQQQLTRTVLSNTPVQPVTQGVETSQQQYVNAQPGASVQTYGYTPVQGQTYEPSQQQYVNPQTQSYPSVERQGTNQQLPAEQFPVQNQVLHQPQQQQQELHSNVQQVFHENPEKQGTFQQDNQQYTTDYTQTPALRTGEPNQHIPNPQPQTQVYQQQVTGYTQEQVQKTQQVTPQQQVGQQVYTQVETQQQGTGYTENQGYKTQGVTPQQQTIEPVQPQVGSQVQPQNTDYPQQPVYRTQDVTSNQQQYNAQPQTVNHVANVSGNFGDKISPVQSVQQPLVDPASVQNYSAVPQQSVEQSSVVVPQQQVVSQ